MKGKNMWKTITVLLAIVVVVLIIKPSTSNISLLGGGNDEVGEKVVDYVSALGGGQANVELREVTKSNGLDKVTLNIEGYGDVDFYVSEDGKLLLQGTPFEDIGTIQEENTQNNDVAQNSPGYDTSQGQLVDMADFIDDDDIKGDLNAPVTIVEWSDFECPFCARFYTETLGQIEEEYINTGKVRFAYRDFPLNFHANAQKSAEAAECAGEQGKFWEMHDLLFEQGVDGGVSSFKQFAIDMGLDSAAFDECLDSGAMASEVSKDMQDGQAAGVTGTPGFIINGQLVSGAQPFSAFEQIIEAELAK